MNVEDIVQGIEASATPIVVALVLSLVGYAMSMRSIPLVMKVLFDRNIYGIDINKSTLEQRQQFGAMRKKGEFTEAFKKLVVPESLGIVVGGIYLCIVFAALLLTGLPLVKANGAVTSIAVMLLLGFVDDVLDVRWRYKIVLSIFGAMPLVMAYDGSLSIAVPIPLRSLLETSVVYLGPIYLLYLVLLCVFCTNSINILAGVNGVEVGQSLVIGCASLVYNIVQLRHSDTTTRQQHVLCIILLMPFLAVSYALWKFNRYPSRVFVGDSYTYFAGIVLAVAGVSGVYSKTLMLFFMPQLINFILSIPQLLHVIPCPRHRVPTWIADRDVLRNSRNGTILNAILWICGDMHERTLTRALIVFQIVCCIVAFYVRFFLAGLVFENVV